MSDAPASPPPDSAGSHQSASTGEITKDAAADDPKHPTIAIKVYSPFKIYYEGRGFSISGVNGVGPFDILPHHHNFLCMLDPCDLKVKTPHGDETVKIYRGLMHVKADAVTVFVDV